MNWWLVEIRMGTDARYVYVPAYTTEGAIAEAKRHATKRELHWAVFVI